MKKLSSGFLDLSVNTSPAKPSFSAALTYLLLFVLFLLIVSIAILACVPPVSRDALTQHLTLPKLYLHHGRIYEIPELDFSYNPMNLDLLYMICLYFKNDILPKFVHFFFALVTAGLIYHYLKKRLNNVYAILGAIFFLSIPIIVNLSTSAYVDLGLICFSFASLLCLLKWVETGYELRWLVVSGIFCGLGLGTKYNGLITLFLVACFIPLIYLRSRSADGGKSVRSMGYALIFVSISLLLYAPWGIRNYAWTKNPIYPLFDHVISSGSGSDRGKIEKGDLYSKISELKLRKDLFNESPLQVLLIPIRIFFQGKDGDPKYFDGRLNPFLFFLPFFAFFNQKSVRQEKMEKLIFLFFSILFILFVFARRDMRIRYVAPVIPPLVILSVYGLNNAWQYIESRTKKAGTGSVFIFKLLLILCIMTCFMLNLFYIFDRYQYLRPIQYITGKISPQAYIQRYWPEYGVFRYANSHLSQKAKILGLYIGKRGYYIDRDITFDYNLLYDAARTSRDAYEIAKKLNEDGITHLIVNYQLFNFWVNKNLSADALKRLSIFFVQNVKRLYRKDGVGIYELKPV